MARSILFSMLLLVLIGNEASALLSTSSGSSSSSNNVRTSAPRANNRCASSSSSLYLCPGEGNKLVAAFNEAVAKGTFRLDKEAENAPTEQLQEFGVAAQPPPPVGLMHRLRHALDTIATSGSPADQELLP